MRLADILKKIQQGLPQQEQPAKDKEVSKKEEIFKPKEEVKIVDEISQESSVEQIYGGAINAVRNLFRELATGKTLISTQKLRQSAQSIAELVSQNNQELLLYSCYSTVDSYIYAHSVNVGIYSGVIGVAKELSFEELKELVLCGLLHDIGMASVLHIAEKKQKLSEPEFEEIKNHSKFAQEEIAKLDLPGEVKNKIVSIVTQVHERVDGSGYLKGLKSDDIEFFARIISIADVYEAMTHPRPYRERILPHDAVVALVKQAQTELDTQLVKLFIDRISIFPVGSYVKLNTGDIARVIATNPAYPLRPKVKIILTAEKYAPKDIQVIDLSQNSQIVITEAVDETKIETKDRKLLLQIKAQRWWVKDSNVL